MPELPILLCPGPVETSEGVRGVLAESDYCHRDVAFRDMTVRVCSRLARLLDAPHHDVLLLSGGGTAAMEAALGTFVGTDEEILVVSNGAFGERIADMARVHGARLRELTLAWGTAVQPDDVARQLDANPDVRVVALVHHETSVGALNPVARIGEMLHERGVRFIVDAVSSVGAEPLSLVESHIGLLVGSANKCLHGIAGVSFVAVDRDWWKAAERVPRRSLFLDLRHYREAIETGQGAPFTPPVAPIVALDRALEELLGGGGPEARQRHYALLNERLRQGLQEIGLVPRDITPRSRAMTLARLPDDVDFERFQSCLRELGFLVYPAKAPLDRTHFIVANMGDLDLGTIEAFLLAAREVAARSTRATPVSRRRT